MSSVNWLQAEPEIVRVVDELTKTYQRIRATVGSDYVHRHVLQTSFKSSLKQRIKDGHADSDTWGLKPGAPPFAMSRQETIDYVSSQGEPVRMLMLFAQTKLRIVCQLGEALFSALDQGNLLVSFICARSLIEQIAAFDRALEKSQKITPKSDAIEELRQAQNLIHDHFSKWLWGRRIDWEALVASPNMVAHESLPYKPRDFYVNQTSENVLTTIEKLNKKIPGTSIVYETLCEFAHPNVGTVIALTRSVQSKTDSNRTEYEDHVIGLGIPTASLMSFSKQFQTMFLVLGACLEHVETLMKEKVVIERQRVLQLCQIVVRHHLSEKIIESEERWIRIKDAFDPYSDCPCASGEKLKFCCRQ
ncbi:MAG TPA: hypothetical protein V6C81_02190 [Planktothrix sp.]|jgi:hypothetical protein